MNNTTGLSPEKMTACYLCRRPIFSGGAPMLYRLRLEQHVADVAAIRQLAGVEMITGSSAVARALAPVNRLTAVLWSVERNVCLPCVLGGASDALPLLVDCAEQDAKAEE